MIFDANDSGDSDDEDDDISGQSFLALKTHHISSWWGVGPTPMNP